MEFKRKKYTRTYHLPWSKGVQSDDKLVKNLDAFFENSHKEWIVWEKLDGECTTLHQQYYHARSIDSGFNFTRAWVASLHAGLRWALPPELRFVGENMWAEHSIRYPDDSLEGYFYLFSIWRKQREGGDYCLSYDEIVEWAKTLDLPMPKVFYRGRITKELLIDISESIDTKTCEGFVLRSADGFHEKDTNINLAKWVREGHVQPNAEHWLKNAKQNGVLKEIVKPSFMGKKKV